MKRMKILAGAVAIVLLMALLVACGGGDNDANGEGATATGGASAQVTATSEPEVDETATEEDEEPTATAASEDEDPTETTEAADATEPADDRIVGTASVEDESKDVVNILMDEPDDPMPGVDLTSVRLEGDGEQLTVTIQTAGDIAGELSDDVDVSFDVHLWQDDMPAYALSLQKNGSDVWEASVTDFTGFPADEESIETEITLSGNTLSANFPSDMLPELEAEFEWYSSVMLSESGSIIGPDSWFDGAPENIIALLADPEEFVEFPQ